LNVDLANSNLPASPAFVPLIGELTGRLLGARRVGEAVPCGEPLALYLPAAAGPPAGLTIVGPTPGENGQLVEEGSGVLWRSPAAGEPGVYLVKRDGRAVFAAAVAVPAEESDLRSLEPSVFQGRLAGGRRVYYRSAA